MPSAAQAAPGVAMTLPDTLQWDLHSSQGSAYRVFLYRPPGPPPANGYPVLYVLDGNAMFLTAVEAV